MQLCIFSNSMVFAQPQLHCFHQPQLHCFHQDNFLSCEYCRSFISSWSLLSAGLTNNDPMRSAFNPLLYRCIVGIHPFHHQQQITRMKRPEPWIILLLAWICFAVFWHPKITKLFAIARQFVILPLRKLWNQDNQLCVVAPTISLQLRVKTPCDPSWIFPNE